jgi:enamine deaminase RidA (YjgF/YER057c/UK114 family)
MDPLDASGGSLEIHAIGHDEVPAVADYSQVIRAGSLLFIAGQIGVGPDGHIVSHDPEEQITQSYLNMGKLLNAAGGDLDDVVKITQYLVRDEDREVVRRVRPRFFKEPYPVSTLLIVKQLASTDYLYEVDAIAVLGRRMSRGSIE